MLSFYDETSTIVECVTVRIVASAVFCSSRISCLKFHFESDHIVIALTSFKYSYRGYSKKKCDVSSDNKDKATTLVPLKNCTENKTTSLGVEMEYKLCLFRIGLFDEEEDYFYTISSLHKDDFGFGW